MATHVLILQVIAVSTQLLPVWCQMWTTESSDVHVTPAEVIYANFELKQSRKSPRIHFPILQYRNNKECFLCKTGSGIRTR